MGIIAFRNRWPEHLTDRQARFWGRIALTSLGVFIIVVAVAKTAGIEPIVFMGGLSLPALFLAAWESTACLSIIIWLTAFFRKHLNTEKAFFRTLARNSYTVYILHEGVIVGIMIAFLSVQLPTALKFLLVSLMGLPFCFLLSHWVVRRLPLMNRIF